MEIQANEVLDNLTGKVGELMKTIAILEVQQGSLKKAYDELFQSTMTNATAAEDAPSNGAKAKASA